jgi:RHS repeat-associated protein
MRELSGSDQVVKEYMRGLDLGGGIRGIIYQKKSSDYYFYHYNHKGDVVALTDANGKLAAFYEYDTWGNTMTEAEKTGVDNPYRYSTKEWDEKSGLYYFGARYYSPEIGRWTQRELLGWIDGPNMYAYVRNQPTNLIDAFGIYGQATHEDLTTILALHAGYHDDLAAMVGHCNQMVDDLWPAEWLPWPFQGRRNSRAYHFPSRGRLQRLKAEALDSCDPCDLGKYLHALQDSHSHGGYSPGTGHGEWVWEDRMGLYPQRAYTMAQNTYNELRAFGKECCGRGLWKGVGKPDRWSDFESDIRRAIRRDHPLE